LQLTTGAKRAGAAHVLASNLRRPNPISCSSRCCASTVRLKERPERPVIKPRSSVILTGQRNEEAACLIAGAGARLLFLPPYSPDLKPIEMEFAKAKELLRRAPEPSTRIFMGRTRNMFTPEECANHVRHCG